MDTKQSELCIRPGWFLQPAGVALLELLVVILIVGMISAIIVPSMSSTMTGVRLKTASRDVLNILRVARETAIRNQAMYKVHVDFVKQVLSVTDAFGESVHQYPMGQDVEVEAVRIEGSEAIKQEVVDIFFYPEGHATGAEIVLWSPHSKDRPILRTDAVTGTARILSGKEPQGR